ncbi:MAG: MotA/TolQ/ExbB proton channel family protein [Fibrobacterota bacterium]
MQFIAQKFQEGGPAMYFITFVFAVAVAIILERLYYYYIKCRVNAKLLLTGITKNIRGGKVSDARKLAASNKSPLAVILESALWHFEQGLKNEEIQNAVDETALREIPRIQKRVHYLSLLGNIATLTGLLGTITGLIASFGSLAAADPSQKAELLARGISMAMNTTAYGLIAAIPCLIAFSILGSKANSLIEEIDESSVRLLNFLFLQRTNQ